MLPSPLMGDITQQSTQEVGGGGRGVTGMGGSGREDREGGGGNNTRNNQMGRWIDSGRGVSNDDNNNVQQGERDANDDD